MDYMELGTMKYTKFKTLCKESTLKECNEYKALLQENLPPVNTPDNARFLQKIRYIDKVISGEIWN